MVLSNALKFSVVNLEIIYYKRERREERRAEERGGNRRGEEKRGERRNASVKPRWISFLRDFI